MSASADNPLPDEPADFDSRDTAIFISDEPGDRTVRPLPSHLLKFLLAERERLIRWGGMVDPSAPEKPADQ